MWNVFKLDSSEKGIIEYTLHTHKEIASISQRGKGKAETHNVYTILGEINQTENKCHMSSYLQRMLITTRGKGNARGDVF